MTYTITLTRYGSGDGSRNTITFDSKTTNPSPSTAPTTFPYDNTKPLIIGFDKELDTDEDAYGRKHGYGASGYLNTWKNLSRHEMYQITVTAVDNSREIVNPDNNRAGASTSMTYSFNLVVDGRNDSRTNQYLMDTVNPKFNGTVFMPKTAYYEDDTISFQQVGVTDEYTTDVQIKYYLVWEATATTPRGYFELDSRFNNNGTISFDISQNNAHAGDILTALGASGGILEMNIVAVAQNFFALTNAVQQNFRPAADRFTMTDLQEYVKDQRAFRQSLVTASREDIMKGIAIEVLPVKLFNLNHGAKATIGLNDDTGTPQVNLDAFWKSIFNTGNESKVIQNKQVYDLPTFTVKYDAATAPEPNKTFTTTVEFSMLLPVSKDTIGILGGTTIFGLQLKQGDPAEEIKGRKFRPEQIGIHTFVCRVYNSGGFVTIFTAQINVVGTPDTEPTIIGGNTGELQIAQRGTLPDVQVRIDGKPFKTDGYGNIYAAYEPFQVMICTNCNCPESECLDPANHESDLEIQIWENMPSGALKDSFLNYKVGTYIIIAEPVGDGHVPASIGNYFIPVAADTYIFTYVLKIKGSLLNDLCISASGDFETKTSYKIEVKGLSEGDIGIKFNDGSYSNLIGSQYTEGGKDTVIRQENTIQQMASTSSRDISMSLAQLNQAMYQTSSGTLDAVTGRWGNDTYQFGRIFLPNMYAQWAENLAQLYDFDLEKHSRVTVSHSKTPTKNIFDSKLIAENSEKKLVKPTKSGQGIGTYYYFQPEGTVSVPKPPIAYAATNTKPGNWPAEVDWNPVLVTEGENAGRYQYFNYLDEKWNSEKYGSGNRLLDANFAPDGIYNVTYSITYKGITSTVEFKIGVGDIAVPIIEFIKDAEDKLFGESYNLKNKKNFRIDTSEHIQVLPNTNFGTTPLEDGAYSKAYVARKLEITILRPDGSTDLPIDYAGNKSNDGQYLHRTPADDSEIVTYEKGKSGDKMDSWGYKLDDKDNWIRESGTYTNREWYFTITESGTYRLQFRIESESGQVAYATQYITVDAPKAKTKISPQTIWGTILIVISSGLLLGVVVYFIQTGRTTKFASGLKGKSAKGKKGGKDADGAVV